MNAESTTKSECINTTLEDTFSIRVWASDPVLWKKLAAAKNRELNMTASKNISRVLLENPVTVQYFSLQL